MIRMNQSLTGAGCPEWVAFEDEARVTTGYFAI